jgi:hypothetical protein
MIVSAIEDVAPRMTETVAEHVGEAPAHVDV